MSHIRVASDKTFSSEEKKWYQDHSISMSSFDSMVNIFKQCHFQYSLLFCELRVHEYAYCGHSSILAGGELSSLLCVNKIQKEIV